jgi:diguanylate cyclase (GGDEF)-like protein
LLLIDVDYFKQINDRFGHEVGDRVLVAVAKEISENARSYDSAARWGGDEFLVLLPHCTLESLRGIGERIIAAVHTISSKLGVEGLTVTASIGGYLADVEEDQLEIFERADKALYLAKASGRNCICIANDHSEDENFGNR